MCSYFRSNAAHHQCHQIVKPAIHLACFTYDTILAGCSPKIRRSRNHCELMYIHLAYIMLFSYFCVACENSEFCYNTFSHNFFDFLCEDCSMYESYSYANCETRYTKNPCKQVYRLLLFRIIALCDTQNVCYMLSVYGT